MLVDCIDHVLIDLHWIFSPEASDPFVLLFLLIVCHNLTLDIGIRLRLLHHLADDLRERIVLEFLDFHIALESIFVDELVVTLLEHAQLLHPDHLLFIEPTVPGPFSW